jgi:hypothetical protein
MNGKVTRGVVAGVVLLSTVAGAAPPTMDQNVCSDMANLRASIAHFQRLEPQTTVKDARQEEERLRTLGQRVFKEAHKDEHARALNAAIGDLGKAVQHLPGDATLASVQGTIHPELDAVTRESDLFSQTYCAAER